MHIGVTVIALLVTAATVDPAFSATSIYTTLDFGKGCESVGGPPTQEDEDLGNRSFLCSGYRDYPVEYDQSDERTTVHYGNPAAVTTARAWESFDSFNTAVDTFEWRVDDRGVPFAAIHRFLISSGEQDSPGIEASRSGQVLVISKVGQPGGPAGCVVGLVDALANAGANDMAREIADALAPKFSCGRDEAVYHGKRGGKSSNFTANFGK